jgi:lipoprotein-releasing system ATP-binding protein
MTLQLRQIEKSFPTPSGPLPILRGIDLDLDAGSNIAIVGPSGSGKSTLLSVIGTLDPPTSGTVLLDSEDPYKLPEKSLAAFRRNKIGFIFQDHHLLPQCSVLENVLLPMMADGRADEAAAQRATMLLQSVGLGERLDHRPAHLSGGEKQRAAVCRALMHRPSLILADEPTGNLDRVNALEMADLLLKMQEQQDAMLIVVTHSETLAGRLERRLELNEGILQEI